VGGVITQCPAGTYGATMGLTSSACSGPCAAAPGNYCPAGTITAAGVPCPFGSTCAGGTAAPVAPSDSAAAAAITTASNRFILPFTLKYISANQWQANMGALQSGLLADLTAQALTAGSTPPIFQLMSVGSSFKRRAQQVNTTSVLPEPTTCQGQSLLVANALAGVASPGNLPESTTLTYSVLMTQAQANAVQQLFQTSSNSVNLGNTTNVDTILKTFQPAYVQCLGVVLNTANVAAPVQGVLTTPWTPVAGDSLRGMIAAVVVISVATLITAIVTAWWCCGCAPAARRRRASQDENTKA